MRRRDAIKRIGFTAASLTVAGTALGKPNSSQNEISVAAIGVGGKGWTDANGAARGAHVVAFCDVDTGGTGRRGGFAAAARQWPDARRYTDWRELLDKEAKNIQGITVSTPDHMHAAITMSALELGIGAYTQKPLTRTVHEARQLTLAAKKAGVATQMGNQHHSGLAYRTLVQIVQDGAIGKIVEAHAWSNRPIWPQGIERPARRDPVPNSLNWDLWLGVAAERPFASKVYHPFNWRGWYDFGAGALGDMGCHIIDPVVWSLELGPAATVRCEAPEPQAETFPKWEVIHYTFPGTKYTARETVDVTWYDGGKLPAPERTGLPAATKLPSNGTLFLGEKGAIVTPHGSGALPRLLPQDKFGDFAMPKLKTIDHYVQWTQALGGSGTTTSGFDYAGPLTETVLLGTVACRVPGATLHWDAENLKFTGNTKANEYVRQEYRNGWHVDGL